MIVFATRNMLPYQNIQLYVTNWITLSFLICCTLQQLMHYKQRLEEDQSIFRALYLLENIHMHFFLFGPYFYCNNYSCLPKLVKKRGFHFCIILNPFVSLKKTSTYCLDTGSPLPKIFIRKQWNEGELFPDMVLSVAEML